MLRMYHPPCRFLLRTDVGRQVCIVPGSAAATLLEHAWTLRPERMASAALYALLEEDRLPFACLPPPACCVLSRVGLSPACAMLATVYCCGERLLYYSAGVLEGGCGDRTLFSACILAHLRWWTVCWELGWKAIRDGASAACRFAAGYFMPVRRRTAVA